MSAGRFLRARPRRAVSVAWALALLSRRLGLVCAGVSSSPPVGRGYMARGGGGREEESLGALPSPAPGAARARPSPASLLRALPAPPPRSSRARPGRVAAASAPHPLPGRLGGWEGARRKRGGLLSPPWRGPQRRAAAARAPPPLLPHNPTPGLPSSLQVFSTWKTNKQTKFLISGGPVRIRYHLKSVSFQFTKAEFTILSWVKVRGNRNGFHIGPENKTFKKINISQITTVRFLSSVYSVLQLILVLLDLGLAVS